MRLGDLMGSAYGVPMVVYDLICENNHRFEGWFPSFESYQKQAAQSQLSCPTCNSPGVEKLPHACAVHLKKEIPKARPAASQRPSRAISETDARELLFRLHHYVRENFEDVGTRFAEEARKSFHGEVDPRPIHGSATPEEREQLDDEGIPFITLPKPELDG